MSASLGVASYDRSRAGVAYVMKCLTEGTLGANEYELRKFNLADTVTLSRSVIRVIADLERMGTDARHERVKRQAGDELVSASVGMVS
jgi:hypothetical protein